MYLVKLPSWVQTAEIKQPHRLYGITDGVYYRSLFTGKWCLGVLLPGGAFKVPYYAEDLELIGILT